MANKKKTTSPTTVSKVCWCSFNFRWLTQRNGNSLVPFAVNFKCLLNGFMQKVQFSAIRTWCSETTVSARNVFRYLYSTFMFAAFLVIFVFAPLVLLFGSLVFHCPRSFVLRVRIFLHIVYLAFIVIFRVSSSFSCAWSSLQFNVWVFARPSFSFLSLITLSSLLITTSLPYSKGASGKILRFFTLNTTTKI